MQINKTSIVTASSASSAIFDLINESFSKVYIKIFLEGLIVDGDVGTVVEIDKGDTSTSTTTSYFIVTPINAALKRVEYCSNTTYKYNDPAADKLMNS